MMSMKVSCSWRLFVRGVMGSGVSAPMGSRGDKVAQSMSGWLKSPAMSLHITIIL